MLDHGILRPMAVVRLIGYWAGLGGGGIWPDPHDFVDPAWDLSARALVAEHLVRGTRVNVYRGLSPCRFCGRQNGSAELTDGQYCWPEGLADYIVDHDVRLPDEFVAHVRSARHTRTDSRPPIFDDTGQRDPYWPDASPWGDETPWNEEWWTEVVRNYVEQGGLMPSTMSLSQPCELCGFPDGAAPPMGESFCCMNGLASYLWGASGRGGPEFDGYRLAVIRSLAPPRHGSVRVDHSWWRLQRSVCAQRSIGAPDLDTHDPAGQASYVWRDEELRRKLVDAGCDDLDSDPLIAFLYLFARALVDGPLDSFEAANERIGTVNGVASGRVRVMMERLEERGYMVVSSGVVLTPRGKRAAAVLGIAFD